MNIESSPEYFLTIVSEGSFSGAAKKLYVSQPYLSRYIIRLEKELGAKPAGELQHIKKFHKAEEYHQDYLDKNPGGYCHLSPELFKLAAKYRKK